MVEKKCLSNAKASLCLPQRPLGYLRLLQNRDAPGAVEPSLAVPNTKRVAREMVFNSFNMGITF
jgi:hypothetical protein